MPRRGFTLIELLVVIGIIAVLLGIFLPTLSTVRQTARSTRCLSQMRQIGLATLMYAGDHQGQFPRSSHSALAFRVMPWGYALQPYLSRGPYTGPGASWDALFNGIYRCPSDERPGKWSYGKNVWFELGPAETGEIDGASTAPIYPKLSNVRRPAATILFAELGSGSMADHVMAHFWYLGGAPEVDAKRHGRTSNYVFVDGHAEPRDFSTTFQPPGLDLWHPGRAR